ncbi:alginate O-acetyltransferase AlgX-related protein [Phycicoccus sonneratiae]|uniref:AlgX/AlgJ SGNH hydrolase-like domain-containing protein n=1 Tax=Phycicoccus sonneratiae TaxID=2807628 RepID=A0ABS2CM96_9MICO|nr:hypothetical protein [Phycicoccus sonneraticus]MBM6400996.1 hypothetical protein [Phycicoccus sonneraticus]
MTRPGQHRRLLPVVVAGGVFVFGPLVAGLAGARATALENRPLADRPSLSAGWKVFDEASLWVSDHLPVRTAAVQARSEVVRGVFGDHAVEPTRVVDGVAWPSVVEGRDRWLYAGGDFVNACHPQLGVEETVERLERMTTLLREHGRTVAVVVVPDKSTVVDDGLPARYLGRACAAERKDAFWSAYTGRDPDFLDLRPALEEADAGPGRAYLRSDSHWTPAGALVYARAVVDHVAPGTWEQSEVRAGAPFRKQGDLASVLLEDRVDEVPGWDVVRPEVRLDSESRSGDFTFRTQQSSDDPGALVRGRTAIIGDSFTFNSRAAWTPWFERSTTRHWVKTEPDLVLHEMVESDTVVLELVERDIATGDLGVFDEAFVDRLEAGLRAAD